MRYVNIKDLNLPPNWQKRSDAVIKSLTEAKDNTERISIISKNEHLWKELFVPLSDLSNGKCWYSEAKELMSSRDVDHFRPKSEALDLEGKSRDGYWFLAFDWENYRFASEYSNRIRKDKFIKKPSAGKGAYFPLFAGSIIADKKNKLVDEDIVLIDPCNQHDVALISFDERGEVVPAKHVNSDKQKERVRISVWLYHLDHEPLREEREKIWERCQRLINQLEHLIQGGGEDSAAIRGQILFIKDQIKEMASIQNELSAVAIACIEHNQLYYLNRT